MMASLWLSLGVLTQGAGLVALRASSAVPRRSMRCAAYLGIIGSVLPVSLAMSEGMSLAMAYAIWTGAGIAFSAIGGAVLFRDLLTPRQAAGILLILGGVALLYGGR